jgi:hypothetical protein
MLIFVLHEGAVLLNICYKIRSLPLNQHWYEITHSLRQAENNYYQQTKNLSRYSHIYVEKALQDWVYRLL